MVALHAKGNDLVEGYLISSTHDSIRCKIHTNGLELFNEVHIVDSLGNERIYGAAQASILGFGFIYKHDRYDYVPITEKSGQRQFLIRIAEGKRFNLYYYFETGDLNTDARNETYFMEDPTGDMIGIGYGFFFNYKKQIREFFHGDSALRLLFNKTVFTFRDIPKFVRAANKQ